MNEYETKKKPGWEFLYNVIADCVVIVWGLAFEEVMASQLVLAGILMLIYDLVDSSFDKKGSAPAIPGLVVSIIGMIGGLMAFTFFVSGSFTFEGETISKDPEWKIAIFVGVVTIVECGIDIYHYATALKQGSKVVVRQERD